LAQILEEKACSQFGSGKETYLFRGSFLKSQVGAGEEGWRDFHSSAMSLLLRAWLLYHELPVALTHHLARYIP
jgi:hypothetical protein